ncbi:MAG: hypothetical protein K2H22_06270 [Muribaculaceae bacterium]|nr:hypothetical protein [Muribaculaceae bacterium]
MIRRFGYTFLLSVFCLMVSAQTKISLIVGDRSMTATLADNEATRSLVSLLEKGPFRIDMEDYGGFEKVGELPESLPVSNSQISTVPGDIMLYLGRNMVIFYGGNSWNYTPLGKIDNAGAEEIRDFLGSGSVTLTVALVPEAGVSEIVSNCEDISEIYDIEGKRVSRNFSSSGIKIVNGKKVISK